MIGDSSLTYFLTCSPHFCFLITPKLGVIQMSVSLRYHRLHHAPAGPTGTQACLMQSDQLSQVPLHTGVRASAITRARDQVELAFRLAS